MNVTVWDNADAAATGLQSLGADSHSSRCRSDQVALEADVVPGARTAARLPNRRRASSVVAV
jgi:hypothetical protein